MSVRTLCMRLIRAIAPVGGLCVFLTVVQCTTTLCGGSSEVGNPVVTGRVVDSLGQAAAATAVHLIAVDHNILRNSPAVRIVTDTTDAAGRYRLRAPGQGQYNVQALRSTDASGMLAMRINVTGDSVHRRDDTLQLCGRIRVALTANLARHTAGIYVPGTLIGASLDIDGDYCYLEQVPPGLLPPLWYQNGDTVRMLNDSLQVTAAQTTYISMPGWRHARTLVLNTSPAGAAITADQYAFPVLIRLNSSNFDFSQARSDGADLRITKPDGTVLPCKTERWESDLQRAEIWCRIDTVRGDNDSQPFIMYWGCDMPGPGFESGAVFDTSQGYQAVWHMAAVQDARIPDAGRNAYHGTAYNLSAGALVEGVIGPALHFDGESSYISVYGTADSKLNFGENGTYTLYAWINLDTIDSGVGQVFISKGDWQYNLDLDRETSSFHLSEYHGGVGLQRTRTVASAGAWHCLVGVHEGAAMRLYLDGVLVSDTSFTFGGSMNRDQSQNVTLGRIANEASRYLDGKLDEVRILDRAVDPQWVRLCYMNQKPLDALVEFR